MTGALRIEDSALTDTGLVRPQNEDSHVALGQAQLWVVADGMGGHENGQFASRTIVEAASAAALPDDLEGSVEAIAHAVQDANRTIFATAQDAGKMMGSTVVALVLRGSEFAVLWAGDSRAYLLRDGSLYPLTRDHSQVQAMLDQGMLSAEEAADHPMRHVLSRAVGVQPALELDAIRDQVVKGDLFLLSSDGLHGVVPEDEIADMLRRHESGAARPLVEAALARGAPDNVTVVLVAANEPTLLSLEGQESSS